MKELPCERRRRRSKHIDVIVNDLREFLCPCRTLRKSGRMRSCMRNAASRKRNRSSSSR